MCQNMLERTNTYKSLSAVNKPFCRKVTFLTFFSLPYIRLSHTICIIARNFRFRLRKLLEYMAIRNTRRVRNEIFAYIQSSWLRTCDLLLRWLSIRYYMLNVCQLLAMKLRRRYSDVVGAFIRRARLLKKYVDKRIRKVSETILYSVARNEKQ